MKSAQTFIYYIVLRATYIWLKKYFMDDKQ